MSTTAFESMEHDRLKDEEYAESVRIERLALAGKLCPCCFGTRDTIRRHSSQAWICLLCGNQWDAP